MDLSTIDLKEWVLIGTGIFAVTAYFYALYTSRSHKSKDKQEDENP